MTWEDIEGWFDYENLYAEEVKRAKPGARFVEIGAWLGKSTAFLAQQIKDSGKDIELHVVDSWANTEVTGDNGSKEEGAYAHRFNGKTETIFLQNMADCGLSDYLHVIKDDSCEAAKRFEDKSVDFVFIDGDHSASKVYQDCCAWWPKVKPGGLLAGHDYDEIGPRSGATRFAKEIGKAIYGDGVFAVDDYKCWGIPKPSDDMYHIFLAIPHYDGNVLAPTMMTACLRPFTGNGYVAVKEHGSSALAANFNHLWCMALNRKDITHFAMLHADIVPQWYWLDVLMRELEQENAQMVSVISPIKDNYGVSSTGIAHPTNHYTAFRRITMREAMNIPSTMDSNTLGYPDKHMVLNTGCWLADIRDERWRKEDENGELYVHFEMQDMIKNVCGAYSPFFEPEDFYFSRRAQEVGLRCVATRKPQIIHMGNQGYRNSGRWGEWEHDERTKPLWFTEGMTYAEIEAEKCNPTPAAAGTG